MGKLIEEIKKLNDAEKVELAIALLGSSEYAGVRDSIHDEDILMLLDQREADYLRNKDSALSISASFEEIRSHRR
ncbi:MAG: hypothetical protein U0176_24665 [Bacteroidia bacterium]